MKAILVTLLLTVKADLQEKCSPIIFAPNSPIFIYKESNVIDVTLYSCQYLEERQYYACTTEFYELYEVTGTVKTGYGDITSNCINALKRTVQFKDKYGFPHNITKNKTYTADTIKYDCRLGYYTLAPKIKTLELKVQADLARNELTLPSGTICRYGPGFCYDSEEDADFVWEVEVQKQRDVDCKKLEKIATENGSYYLINMTQNYLFSRLDQGYAVLELDKEEEVCGKVVWKTKKNSWFLTHERIKEATPTMIRMKIKEYTFYSEEKQPVYDFLLRKCWNYSENLSNFDLAHITLTTATEVERATARVSQDRARLEEDRIALNALKEDIEALRNRILFVIIGILICVVITVIGLVGQTITKRITAAGKSCLKTNRGEPLYNDTYETVTSEYNINSVYGQEGIIK